MCTSIHLTDTIQLGALCGFSACLLYAVTGESCTHNCTHMQTPKVQTLLSKQKSLFTKVNNLKYTSAKAQMHVTIKWSDTIFMGENFQFLKIPHIGWSINKYCHRDNQANNYALQFTSNQSIFCTVTHKCPSRTHLPKKNKHVHILV